MPTKVTKYWSNNPTDPDVWHDYKECSRGKLIPSANKETGTPPPNYRRCKTCIDLD